MVTPTIGRSVTIWCKAAESQLLARHGEKLGLVALAVYPSVDILQTQSMLLQGSLNACYFRRQVGSPGHHALSCCLPDTGVRCQHQVTCANAGGSEPTDPQRIGAGEGAIVKLVSSPRSAGMQSVVAAARQPSLCVSGARHVQQHTRPLEVYERVLVKAACTLSRCAFSQSQQGCNSALTQKCSCVITNTHTAV